VIEVTKLDGEQFYVSPHQIEFLDETPDTVLHMITGKKVIVQEDSDTIIDRIVEYRQRIGNQDIPSRKTD